jgi:hypothetical protein
LESEAHDIGDAVTNGATASSCAVPNSAAPQIQRWPWSDDESSLWNSVTGTAKNAFDWGSERFKKNNDIKDKGDQNKGNPSAWNTYNQWNNALTGKTAFAKETAKLEDWIDSTGENAQTSTNNWVDKHTDEGSWLRTIGHGAANGIVNTGRNITEAGSGLLVGGLSTAMGMADTIAHPIDTAIGLGIGLKDDLAFYGNQIGNVASVLAGTKTWEETGREFMTGAKETMGGRFAAPFIRDIQGDPNRMINGKPDSGGHWARVIGRGAGTIGVGMLGGELGELAGAGEAAGTPAPAQQSVQQRCRTPRSIPWRKVSGCRIHLHQPSRFVPRVCQSLRPAH